MSASQNTALVTNALHMAVIRRRPAGVVVHHSDQGCQDSSYDFAQACRLALGWARWVIATTAMILPVLLRSA